MAYLRVTRSQWDPAVAEDLASLAEDFAAAYRRLPGLQHVHGGTDRAGGKGIVVGIFDTEEHARFDPETLGAVAARIMALGIRIEGPDFYEVTL